MEPDYDKIIRQLGAALDKAEKFPAFALPPVNSSASTITFNAGGVGIWLVCTACLLMLVINIGMMFLLMEERQVNRDQMHQLNSIYAAAPQLRNTP